MRPPDGALRSRRVSRRALAMGVAIGIGTGGVLLTVRDLLPRHAKGDTVTVGWVQSSAAGDAHSVAISGDGTVWSWGDNTHGQLGQGFVSGGGGGASEYPVQAVGLSAVAAVAAGSCDSLAIRTDGTVWSWGCGYSGAPYGTSDTGTPAQVAGLSGVVAVAAGPGSFHTLALKGDGSVWAWGDNQSGDLGNGTTASSATPVQASGLSGVLAIASGGSYSLALKADGTVWSWGGMTGTVSSSTPVQIGGLSGVIGIAVGTNHAVALKTDGTVWSWGDNSYGELGKVASTTSATPVQIAGLKNPIAVAAGHDYSLALLSDDSVWTWGATLPGSPADVMPGASVSSTTTSTSTQLGVGAPVPMASQTVNLSSTSWSATLSETTTSTSLGQTTASVTAPWVVCCSWTPASSSPTPTQVSGLSGMDAIAAGYADALAVKGDGTEWSWGDNTNSQLGAAGAGGWSSSLPVQVTGSGGTDPGISPPPFATPSADKPASDPSSGTVVSNQQAEAQRQQVEQAFYAQYAAWLASLNVSSMDLHSLPRYPVMGSPAPGQPSLQAAVTNANVVVVGTVASIVPTALNGTQTTISIDWNRESGLPGSKQANIGNSNLSTLVVNQSGGLRPTPDWSGATIADDPGSALLLPGDQVVLLLQAGIGGANPSIQSISGWYEVVNGVVQANALNPWGSQVNGMTEPAFLQLLSGSCSC